ncbi:hypothetical protein ACFOW6_13080 [Fodinicurvata halophila]|uniref:HAMP domain-containing protein n=1 Tax=Fodinicurvata halophila TaxID=1419723 RepID=A0ABV8UMG6_9PROT
MAFDNRLRDHLSGRLGRRLVAPLLVFLLVLLASLPVVWLGLQHMERELASEREAAQRAMGDVMTREIGRALSYGVPLEEIPDLESYLDETRARLPVVVAAEVASDGEVLARAGDAQALENGRVMTLTLQAENGRVAGSLRLARQPGQLAQVVGPLGLTAGLAAALASLLAALGCWLFAWRPLRVAEADLIADMERISSGDFAQDSPAPSGLPSDLTLAALQELKTHVNTRCFLVRQQAAGLRAIDFDESLSAPVSAIMTPVEEGCRFRSDSVSMGGLSAAGGGF